MLFFHKWYVFFVSAYNVVRAIYKTSSKIAAIRVELVTHDEIKELEEAMLERLKETKGNPLKDLMNTHESMSRKDMN